MQRSFFVVLFYAKIKKSILILLQSSSMFYGESIFNEDACWDLHSPIKTPSFHHISLKLLSLCPTLIWKADGGSSEGMGKEKVEGEEGCYGTAGKKKGSQMQRVFDVGETKKKWSWERNQDDQMMKTERKSLKGSNKEAWLQQRVCVKFYTRELGMQSCCLICSIFGTAWSCCSANTAFQPLIRGKQLRKPEK